MVALTNYYPRQFHEGRVLMAHIVYLSPYFWPESIGSAPYCTDVANALKSEGHEVDVYAFRPHYPSIDRFLQWQDGSRDIELLNGIVIHRCSASGRGEGGFKTRLKNDLRFLWHAIRAAFSKDTEGVDSVVACVPSTFAALGGAFIAKWRRARFLIVVHDIESGLAQALGIVASGHILWAMRLLERIVFNRADLIIVLTNGMKTELRSLGCSRPIQVLPIWSEVFPEMPDSPDKVRVGYSGNFGKKQNIDQILPLIERLYQLRPDIDVILRGDGSEKSRIALAVAGLGVKNVHFEELAPQERFVEALQEISIHLVPQALNVANYALPSKLTSIMAAGRPFVCIAEPHSPLNEIVLETGAGVCVQPGQEDALVETMIKLADDLPRRREMGLAGRQYVAAHMNRAKILREYIAITLHLDAGAQDGVPILPYEKHANRRVKVRPG